MILAEAGFELNRVTVPNSLAASLRALKQVDVVWYAVSHSMKTLCRNTALNNELSQQDLWNESPEHNGNRPCSAKLANQLKL
ncbi:hypothetical protein J6590_047818 [Homalodisca vitripennis]|nr:hypothetical protein J6590_047818 [Homalodisca vitripennis]